MNPKKSKRLVIDTDVARSAGGDNAVEGRSRHCREFLQAVLKICHKIDMSRELYAEWKQHRSSFARQWLASMVAKKKFHLNNISVLPADEHEIREAMSEFDADAMIKDLHLVKAASAGDEIVVSLDENARKHFQQLGTFASVAWFNPHQLSDTMLDWLEDGAPKAGHTLGDL